MSRTQRQLVWIITIFAFCLTLYFVIIRPRAIKIELENRQNELADLLGIDIEQYDRRGFPDVYFLSVLQPGMTASEVHRIVLGYEMVFICNGDYQDELYYYYSLDDRKATRFMIYYDSDGIYYDFRSEDPGSRTLPGRNGCKKGLRDEQEYH